MRRIIKVMCAAACLLFFTTAYSANTPERKLVLRQAQEIGKTSVAIEAYLDGNVLEATVYARMYGTKPKIFNIVLVGPKLGRLSPRSRQTLYPTPEEEDKDIIFPTTDMRRGLINFSKKTKDKRGKGSLTRELDQFKVPKGKILPNKRYEFRVWVESMQDPGKTIYFSFPLKDFDKLFTEN